MLRKSLLFATAFVFASGPGLAHKPTYSVNEFSTPDTAYVVENIDVSIVVKDEVNCAAPFLWLTYDVPFAGKPGYFSLLTPKLGDSATFKPSIAILAPGLPQTDQELPFSVPEGMGALVINTQSINPEMYYEPYSKTESWVLFEETIPLPVAGKGYAVAWDPNGKEGKLSVAVGTVEDFGPEDWAKMGEWSKKGKAFHEIGAVAQSKPAPQMCS